MRAYTVRVQATTSTNTIVSDTVKVTVWTDQLWWNTNLAAIPSQITPTNFSFDATYLGKLTNFIRSFGDGRTWVGETTTHTYAAPGTYIVRVQATTPQGYTVFASTTVTVWWWTTVWVVPWAALLPSKLVQQVWEKDSICDTTLWHNIERHRLYIITAMRWSYTWFALTGSCKLHWYLHSQWWLSYILWTVYGW